MQTSKRPASISETSRNDAPRFDRSAATRTFVSRTTRGATSRYRIRYRDRPQPVPGTPSGGCTTDGRFHEKGIRCQARRGGRGQGSIGARLPSALEVHAGVRPERVLPSKLRAHTDGVRGGTKRPSQSPERGDPIDSSSVSRSVGLGPGCLLASARPTFDLRGSNLRARCAERMIDLPGHPQPVQQGRELARHGDDRPLLRNRPA